MANISITFTTLILLVFGAGGIGMTKCACSGKTSLLSINDAGCCPSEGGCMSVTTVQLSDSLLPDHVDMPELMPVMLEAAVWAPEVCEVSIRHTSVRPTPGYPPPRLPLTTVLQV